MHFPVTREQNDAKYNTRHQVMLVFNESVKTLKSATLSYRHIHSISLSFILLLRFGILQLASDISYRRVSIRPTF